MLHSIYTFCCRLVLPFILLHLWWQGRKTPEVRAQWRQRLGYAPRLPKPVIWVHAVSVGETIAAAPLVKALLDRDPEMPILMTAMTLTGTQRAKALFGNQVHYAFAPYDTPGAVRRFLDRVRPRVLVIMETELWPNLITFSRERSVPVFLINARLSERSGRRYERVPSLARPLFQSLTWIAAQAREDASRFVRNGADAEAVSVTGSIKFDVEINDETRRAAAALRQEVLGQSRPVWIAASTHVGEDEQVLAAHQAVLAQHADALLILVPRHPERFDPVAALVAKEGFSLARRSAGESALTCQVYMADTMGELMMLFGASDMAFVGGSLIERGGHNPLEPAAWGLPLLSGPHVFNFAVIFDRLTDGDALVPVDDSLSLAHQVNQLIEDPVRARALGANALAVVEANRGALQKVVNGVLERV
ncbi:MAG: lipid IV(A) 3-deoxy-D-manno-octulosonic acid transferase [Oleiphilaceae bacterium]|nr:lipid IV(A) 3-deoxy-D-manno-octulosonic acid transferase [Oleiphilaceae bacterium]